MECAPDRKDLIGRPTDIERALFEDPAGTQFEVVQLDQALIVEEAGDRRFNSRARDDQGVEPRREVASLPSPKCSASTVEPSSPAAAAAIEGARRTRTSTVEASRSAALSIEAASICWPAGSSCAP